MHRLVVGLCALVTATAALAAQAAAPEASAAPTPPPRIQLKAKWQPDGGLTLRWDRCEHPDFGGYKVVRSYTQASPLYPRDGFLEWITERDCVSYVDYPEPGHPVANYRICVLPQVFDYDGRNYLGLSNVVAARAAAAPRPAPPRSPSVVPEPAPEPATPAKPTPAPAPRPAPALVTPLANGAQLRLLFIHHSCGENWLNDGLRDLLAREGCALGEASYGDGVVGEQTDVADWVPKFRDHMPDVLGFELPAGQTYDVVMFKSCFPNSNVESEQQLRDNQVHYRTILKEFKKHPKVLFLACTAPPLVPRATTKANALRARRFNDWLKNQWADGVANVAVFDLFHVLADRANVLKSAYRRDGEDSHPSPAGNEAASAAFRPFLRAALRAAGLTGAR